MQSNFLSSKSEVRSLKFGKAKFNFSLLLVSCFILFTSCSDPYFKNDFEDNSPTSGKLNIFYDEGLHVQVNNQAYMFEANYPSAELNLFATSENEAVDMLYKDSCKIIVISRPLNEKEIKAFASKDLTPRFSMVAKSGIAFITNIETPIRYMDCWQVRQLLAGKEMKDSNGVELKTSVLFDRKNSSVIHYLGDSLMKGEKFGANCSVLGSTKESIDFVIQNKNAIAVIDFAWLSDTDDSLYKALKSKIKFIAIGNNYSCLTTDISQISPKKENTYEYPNQSSFKLGTYPFTRGVYVIRRSGEFTLGKGFETFVASPQGQMAFLKQGLLPAKQQERNITINLDTQDKK